MARFKKKARRAFARGYSRKSSRRSSRSSGLNPMKVILPALAYGATRNWLKGAAQPITSKLPLGGYEDEALFGVAGYFMAKKGSGLIKDAGLAILTVEAASVGNQVAGNMLGQTSSTTVSSNQYL